MIRSIALGLLVALAVAGLGMLSSPAWAADPAAQPAKRVEGRLWWNDPAVVEKLGLPGDQRAQMDQLFTTYQTERKNAAASRGARARFLEALEQGDMDRAREELASSAEGEQAMVRALGKLRIDVLTLLSEEQRKALESHYPRLIRQSWMPRPSWEAPPLPKRPAGKKQRQNPAN